jgi:hypothetical protein
VGLILTYELEGLKQLDNLDEGFQSITFYVTILERESSTEMTVTSPTFQCTGVNLSLDSLKPFP